MCIVYIFNNIIKLNIITIYSTIYFGNTSYVKNGILYIKPTLTADRFGEQFLFNGTLDLNKEGCNVYPKECELCA